MLNQADAIKILIKAVHVGQKAGSYTLEEAATINNAVNVFLSPSADKKHEEVSNQLRGKLQNSLQKSEEI